MDILKAKKLFAPPDKPDGTTQHLINMTNHAFQELAVELVGLCPNAVFLDEVVEELNKVRLLTVHRIERNVVKSKKQIADEAEQKAKKEFEDLEKLRAQEKLAAAQTEKEAKDYQKEVDKSMDILDKNKQSRADKIKEARKQLEEKEQQDTELEGF